MRRTEGNGGARTGEGEGEEEGKADGLPAGLDFACCLDLPTAWTALLPAAPAASVKAGRGLKHSKHIHGRASQPRPCYAWYLPVPAVVLVLVISRLVPVTGGLPYSCPGWKSRGRRCATHVSHRALDKPRRFRRPASCRRRPRGRPPRRPPGPDDGGRDGGLDPPAAAGAGQRDSSLEGPILLAAWTPPMSSGLAPGSRCTGCSSTTPARDGLRCEQCQGRRYRQVGRQALVPLPGLASHRRPAPRLPRHPARQKCWRRRPGAEKVLAHTAQPWPAVPARASASTAAAPPQHCRSTGRRLAGKYWPPCRHTCQGTRRPDGGSRAPPPGPAWLCRRASLLCAVASPRLALHLTRRGRRTALARRAPVRCPTELTEPFAVAAVLRPTARAPDAAASCHGALQLPLPPRRAAQGRLLCVPVLCVPLLCVPLLCVPLLCVPLLCVPATDLTCRCLASASLPCLGSTPWEHQKTSCNQR